MGAIRRLVTESKCNSHLRIWHRLLALVEYRADDPT